MQSDIVVVRVRKSVDFDAQCLGCTVGEKEGNVQQVTGCRRTVEVIRYSS